MLRKLLPAVYVVLSVAAAHAVPITGKVVGPDDKPVAGAQVVILTGYDEAAIKKPLSLTSDQAGVFKTDLEPITTWPDGFGMATAYVPNMALGGTILKANAGDNIIKLEKSVSVQGMVKDKDGKPLADAIVKLSNVGLPGVENGRPTFIMVPETLADKFTTKSGADGQWKLDGIPANGLGAVLLDDPRYVRAYAQVKAGAAATLTSITARPGATITGRVVHEDGKPAAGIRVNAGGQGVWGTGKTADDGTYTLTGLGSGTVIIAVADPEKKWVTPALENIKVKEGETVKVADAVLTEGALIEGTITDKDSGKPVAGASVLSYGPHQPQGGGAITPEVSDKEGHFKLRVAPGKNTIGLWQAPKYLPLDKTIEVEVQKGETKTVPIQLAKGLTVTGTAVDADGKPAINAEMRASLSWESNRGGGYVEPISFKPDKDGKWSLEGLKPGKWSLVGVGTWEVVGPKELTVPLDAPVKLSVRKTQLLNLVGHVMTKDHKPLEGVRIRAYLQIPEGANSYRGDLQELITDAKGQYTVEKLRPDYKISLSTTMPGYNYVSGGTVTQKDAAFQVQDMVLVPLTAKLQGRVVDATGKPVAGAQVMSPNGDLNLQVPTDATGKFVLTSLPAGQVMVVGGVKDRIGEARDVDGSKPITLLVNPVKPLAGNDMQRAYDILDELWATTEGGKYYRDNIPIAIAPYNPDLAIKLASRKDGTIDDGILSNIINTFSKANSTRAGDWAPPKIEQIKDKRLAFSNWIAFGLNIVRTQPDLAKPYYQKAKDYDKEETAKNAKDQQSILSRSAPLAKLARKLGLNDDADQYTQAAIAAVKATKDQQQQQWSVANITPLDYDQVVKIVDALPIDQRKQSLQQAVSQTASYDPKLARRWLDKLKEVEKTDPNGGGYSGYAAQTLIQVMGKTDPAGALELARSGSEVWSKPTNLAIAAQFQPKDVAVQVLREAGDIASGQQYGSVEPLARVAALTYDLDPKLGAELFATAKEHWETQKAQRENQMWYGGDDGTAAFAFYYSRIDPAASRLMLEAEFSRQVQNPKNDDSYQRSYQIRAIVMAMAAIDVDRALGDELYDAATR